MSIARIRIFTIFSLPRTALGADIDAVDVRTWHQTSLTILRQRSDETHVKCSRNGGGVPHLGSAREILAPCRALRCAGGMGSGLSMSTKRESTRKYAREYASTSKKTRGRMLTTSSR